MEELVSPKKSQSQVERWLSKARAAWRDGYDYLMATKPDLKYYDALLAVWLSCGKDDRGSVKTREDFADFIGVSRAVTYQWQDRRPEILEWVQELVELRLGGSRLADVDERTYQKAQARNGTPADRRLFYERAKVLGASLRVKVSGDEDDDTPVAVDLSDAKLERIASGSGQRTSKS